MKKTVKHDWCQKLHARFDWCRFCGAIRFHQNTGFFGKVKFEYVVPWNHESGDKNKNVLTQEPTCITIEVADNGT